MTEFEAALDACLEALREGRWDIDECLRRYPEHTIELRPQLLVAASLAQAYEASPRPEFAAEARARFLIASGQRIQEAFEADPSPSFFAAARVRFLMAAQKMKLGERARERDRRSFPLFGAPFRGLVAAGVTAVMFLSFSTYTVASASNALPGDWQYPVKLQTERARLALALSEEAKRDVKLDIARERAEELERLTAKGEIIGPGVLDRLANATQPLVEDADEGKLDGGELDRLHDVSTRQQAALQQAATQVAANASEKFEAAINVARDAEVVALAKAPGPVVKEPNVAITPDVTEEPRPTRTPDPANPSATPGAGETPQTLPTATVTPARPNLTVDPEPVNEDNGITWNRLAIGRLTTLIPSEKHGWRVVGLNVSDGPVAAPSLLRLSNIDGTSLITINPRTGDMYWFVSANGAFDEVQMRITKDGETRVQDPESLRRLYGAAAEIPLFILDNIEIAPEPTATATAPRPTSTPEAAP